MHYPSKQTIIIFIVCVAAIAAAAIYIGDKTPPEVESSKQQLSVFAKAQENFASTEMSSSTDWQKSFLNASTSSTPFKTSTRSAANSTTTEELTATDRFGRSVLTQYINLKQAGLMDDASIVSSTISSLIAQSEASVDKPKVYSMKDISVNQNASAATLREYGNEIGMLVKNYAPKNDDAAITLAGIQKKDTLYKQELAENKARYQIILTKLLNMYVPKTVSVYHLALVNGASDMIFISSSFQNAEIDPLKAISGLKLYGDTYQSVLKNVYFIRNALGSQGITYESNEGGAFFKLIKQ